MGQFITPPAIPSDTYCRRILIPNSPEWIGTVTGALMPLIYSSEWVQTTGISPDEAAERALQMFNEYVNSGNDGECGDMACCEEKVTLHRFDPDTGRPQISTDDGVTWKSDPADIQNMIPLYPPPVTDGGSSTKCDAATNASEHINELITATGENLSTAATIFTLAVAVAETILGLFLIIISAGALTAPVTAVATAIWAAATGVFNLGIEAYNAYWTVDKKDAILCALYCNIGDNGHFTDAQYQAFRSKVKSTLPASPALDIIMTAINAGGARGLSQMASYGNAAEADCSSCDCVDCTVTAYAPLGATVPASYQGGCTWRFTSYVDGSNNVVYVWINNPSGVFDPNACGKITDISVVSGTLDGFGGYNDCVTGTLHFPVLDIKNICGSQFYLPSSAPFVVDITFDAC